MSPIINPLWFYLINLSNKLGMIFIIAAIILIVTGMGITLEKEKFVASAKRAIIAGVTCIIISVIIPSKETCYQMMAASLITPDNIEVVEGKTTEMIDYIVESVDKILDKEKKESRE